MQHTLLLHEVSNKWIYLSHTVPNIGHLLKPLDDALQTTIIPTLTGKPPPNDLEHALFALPAGMGGLGITIPSKQADHQAFMMPLHYDTVGPQINYQLSVPVAPLSLSNMLSLVQREAFNLSDTMR